MGQTHAEKGLARLQQGQEDRSVGLCAGMRLHVRELAAKQLLGPLDGQVLGHIHMLAATVVATARVALGVLVG